MYKNFEETEKAYYGYWYTEKSDVDKTIEIAEYAYKTYPEHHQQIILDLIMFYGSSENVENCKRMLKIGFDQGYWYPEKFVEKFWNDEVYKAEVEIWKKLKLEQSHNKVVYEVFLPANYEKTEPYPLFISLHGWGEDLKMFTKFWHSEKLKNDYIHVSLQSSDRIGSSHYQWGDPERAKKEVLDVVTEIKGLYSIENFVVVGGFSEGSTVALELALEHPNEFNGFVSLNPDRPRNYQEKLVESARKCGLRGVILTGDQDGSYHAQKELVKDLETGKIPCQFNVKENFGHWFPEDLDKRIDEALVYIELGTLNYSQLLNKTLELYFEDQYEAAYNFVTEKSKETICNDTQIYNFRYSMACVMGNPKLGLEILAEAVIEKGLWYSFDYLMSDDDLEVMYEEPLFKEVAELCKLRESELVSNPELFKILPKNTQKKTPILVALHGNQENFEVIKDQWDQVVFTDHLKVFPQSSIEEFSTGFAWNDPIKGSLELKDHMNSIGINVMEKPDITLAGFSAGGSVALQSIVDGHIKIKNLFLLAPWLPNLEAIKDQLGMIKTEGIKVVLACGDDDEDCYEETNKLSKALKDLDIDHEYYILEGLQHEYPSNLDVILKEAVDYFNA